MTLIVSGPFLIDELRYGLLELVAEGGVAGLAGLEVLLAGAKVLVKCAPGPVSSDGSGEFKGSMRDV